MGARQDALAAAAEMILFVEKFCTDHAGLVGTVGKLSVKPGAINVIPQDVEFSIDVRSGDDQIRAVALKALAVELPSIATRRNVKLRVETLYDADAAPCDAA